MSPREWLLVCCKESAASEMAPIGLQSCQRQAWLEQGSSSCSLSLSSERKCCGCLARVSEKDWDSTWLAGTLGSAVSGAWHPCPSPQLLIDTELRAASPGGGGEFEMLIYATDTRIQIS